LIQLLAELIQFIEYITSVFSLFKWLIVDDGSTDNTEILVYKWGKKLASIFVIKNSGK